MIRRKASLVVCIIRHRRGGLEQRFQTHH